MGAGEQGDIAILLRQIFYRIDNLAPVGQNHLFPSGMQHQGVREVVDIFRGTGEVDELRDRMQSRYVSHFLFQKVLDRFHVVVSGALNGFNARGVFFTEFRDNLIKVTVCVGSKSRNFLDSCMCRQFLQPAYFYLNTKLQQAEFAEDLAQRADFIAVASIDRGNGGQ